MPRLAGWTLAQNRLSRTFEFQDFVESLSFINSLVAYFETIDNDVGGRVTDRDDSDRPGATRNRT